VDYAKACASQCNDGISSFSFDCTAFAVVAEGDAIGLPQQRRIRRLDTVERDMYEADEDGARSTDDLVSMYSYEDEGGIAVTNATVSSIMSVDATLSSGGTPSARAVQLPSSALPSTSIDGCMTVVSRPQSDIFKLNYLLYTLSNYPEWDNAYLPAGVDNDVEIRVTIKFHAGIPVWDSDSILIQVRVLPASGAAYSINVKLPQPWPDWRDEYYDQWITIAVPLGQVEDAGLKTTSYFFVVRYLPEMSSGFSAHVSFAFYQICVGSGPSGICPISMTHDDMTGRYQATSADSAVTLGNVDDYSFLHEECGIGLNSSLITCHLLDTCDPRGDPAEVTPNARTVVYGRRVT